MIYKSGDLPDWCTDDKSIPRVTGVRYLIFLIFCKQEPFTFVVKGFLYVLIFEINNIRTRKRRKIR